MAGSSVLSNPEVTFNITPSQRLVGVSPQRVLIAGQMLTGTATSGELVEDILNANNEDGLFGANSRIAGMIRNFKALNKVTPVDAIGVADPDGAAMAVSNVSFEGSSTGAGSLTITVGSEQDFTYTFSATGGENGTALATLLNNAISLAAKKGEPFTTAFAGNPNLQFVERNSSNASPTTSVGIRVTGSIPGVTVIVNQTSYGNGEPSTTGILDVVGEKRYQTIAWAFADTEALTDFLDTRFNASNSVLDGVGIIATNGTFAELKAKGDALNSQSLVIYGFNRVNNTGHVGSSMLEFRYNIAAQAAAIRALRLTEGANISSLVTATGGGLDNTGGPAIASLPYFNTPYKRLPLIPTGTGFDATELKTLQASGISTIGNNTAGNETISGEVVTTYKTDSAGNVDDTFKFLNYVDTSSAVREYLLNNSRKRFSQSRLTGGDVVPGRSVANAAVIRAFLNSLYATLAGPDYVLVQAGETARNFFDDNLSIALDLAEGEVTVIAETPLVTQFRGLIGTLRIAFNTQG